MIISIAMEIENLSTCFCLPHAHTDISSGESSDLPIFSPLSDLPKSGGSQLRCHSPTSASPGQTHPLTPPCHGATPLPVETTPNLRDDMDKWEDKENEETPRLVITPGCGNHAATPLVTTSTPGSSARSLHVRISARKLRQIDPPCSPLHHHQHHQHHLCHLCHQHHQHHHQHHQHHQHHLCYLYHQHHQDHQTPATGPSVAATPASPSKPAPPPQSGPPTPPPPAPPLSKTMTTPPGRAPVVPAPAPPPKSATGK